MSVEIRRGSDRFVERDGRRLTRHAFSFGEHYHPDRLAFGPLVCHDEHVLGRGTGFATHEHRDLDIVTWVLAGTLVHTGDDGDEVRLTAGDAAVLRTGGGTRHSEVAGDDGPCHFVQMWLAHPPGDAEHPLTYERASVGADARQGLVPVAGDDAPLALGVPGARLALARLGAGEELALPAAARVHAHVATGALLRSSLAEPLAAGDAFALTDEPSYAVRAAVPAELLVWTFDA